MRLSGVLFSRSARSQANLLVAANFSLYSYSIPAKSLIPKSTGEASDAISVPKTGGAKLAKMKFR